MKRLMLLTAAFTLSATMAMAVTATDLVAAYQTQGFTKIEVTTGLTQIKVEAVKGKTKLEVIYDSTTGAILKKDSGWAGRPDRTPGVEILTSTSDFFNGAGHDGAGNGGHDSDDGANHDAGDDHGGDHESGDHGGDNESGDHGGDHQNGDQGHSGGKD